MGGSPESCIVSGTVQDPSGQIFANGTWQLIFKDAPNSPGPSRSIAVPPTIALIRYFSGNFDSTGSFSQGVLRNDFIAPGGSLYTFIAAPNASSNAYQIDFAASGAGVVNISAAINAAISNIQVQAFPVAHAYKDSEVILTPNSGAMYFDVVKQVLKLWEPVTAQWLTVPAINSLFGVTLTGQTVAQGPLAMFTTPAAGLYRLNISLLMQQAAAAGNIQIIIGWTSAVSAETVTAINMAATALNESDAVITLFSQATQNITFTVAFSGIAGSPIYSLRIRPEFLGS